MSDVTIKDLDDDVSSDDDASVEEMDAFTVSLEVLANMIMSGEAWKLDDEDFSALVNVVRDLNTGIGKLRTRVDKHIWDAQDEGKRQGIKSIRTRRRADAQKPGRKVETKSLRDKLFER